MRTLRERDALLEELWKRFGDVPMDPSTETMEAPFLDFPAGTSRVDIWRWFDERHSKGIAYLIYNEDASNAASITSLLHCQKLCTECCSETCVFNPQGICMAPFLTGKKPGIHDDGCTDYCPKPLDGCELVRSYSEHELRSYEEDVREYISQFTDEELMEAYELDRTTLNALAPRAAVLMRKHIDNDDSWAYHRDHAILEVVSEYIRRTKTMAEKTIPYALRMTLAVLANKPDDARSISAECVTAMTKELMDVVSRYDLMDFPFMVAALQLTATSLESLLDEHGKGIADGIVANTTCITIDASELKRQAKEE